MGKYGDNTDKYRPPQGETMWTNYKSSFKDLIPKGAKTYEIEKIMEMDDDELLLVLSDEDGCAVIDNNNIRLFLYNVPIDFKGRIMFPTEVGSIPVLRLTSYLKKYKPDFYNKYRLLLVD